MANLRTEVSFLTSAFNTTESYEHFINEHNYGSDVAVALMEHLHSRGWHIGADETGKAGQEDFGWYFSFGRDKADHTLLVGHVTDSEGEWLAWVERNAGFLSSLLGGRKKGIQPEAVEAIHEALQALPGVRDIKWSTAGSEEAFATPAG
ncbi:MAG: hypothetical protein ACAH95_00565 [Fimbriimonas sp.]